MRQTHRVRRALFPVGLVGALLVAAPLLAGPPWISIEVPPNPFDAASRGAYLLVHAYHHGAPMRTTMVGSAEGLVRGERRTVPLTFAATSHTGVYALRKQWPSDGTWLLVITTRDEHGGASATALVGLSAGGEVASVRVPAETRDGYLVPRVVAAAEIDAALRAEAARQVAEAAR